MDLFNDIGTALAELDDLPRIGLSLLLIVVAGLVSRWQRADLEKDLLISTVRGFIQLVAIGYVLEIVFDQDNPLWTALILGVMILIAARTSGQRGQKVPGAGWIALVSITFGAMSTLLVLVAAGVFDFTPENIIPIGGMIVGNAMTICSQVMNRMADDLQDQRAQIEARLALGASSREASLLQFRRALRGGMIPQIDTTKTVGLIKLPGAMTGMILAGASPLKAVQLQLIVMYMLVGATTFTGLSTAYLVYRVSFTAAHQLRG